MIALLTACLFFEILVHVLICISKMCSATLKCNLRSWRFCCGARAIAEEMRANPHGNSSLVIFGDLTVSCSWHAAQKNSQLCIRRLGLMLPGWELFLLPVKLLIVLTLSV